jgi:hypothetical protein
MPFQSYYVNDNAQANGDHEVHTEQCQFLPSSNNRRYLGYFDRCQEAVKKARETYPQSNGCYFCSRECNTG